MITKFTNNQFWKAKEMRNSKSFPKIHVDNYLQDNWTEQKLKMLRWL